jgi:hypothetical protein
MFQQGNMIHKVYPSLVSYKVNRISFFLPSSFASVFGAAGTATENVAG